LSSEIFNYLREPLYIGESIEIVKLFNHMPLSKDAYNNGYWIHTKSY